MHDYLPVNRWTIDRDLARELGKPKFTLTEVQIETAGQLDNSPQLAFWEGLADGFKTTTEAIISTEAIQHSNVERTAVVCPMNELTNDAL